ncbi:hypothetical protein AGMMS49579_11410 [Spirochaetia bacterium]|nr:hypothetical protein AGMMS49579_11410 [Spirochaetia bacterium]
MAKRSEAQKIGSFGQRLVALAIEENGKWIARDQTEDFGIDLEAELTEPCVSGFIIKIQIKCHKSVKIEDNILKVKIAPKYLEYALNCRIPIIYVIIDKTLKKIWYVWVQKIVYEEIRKNGKLPQKGITVIVNEKQTLQGGLNDEIIGIATMKNKIQIELSLMDIVQKVTAFGNQKIISNVFDIIGKISDEIDINYSVEYIITQLIDVTGEFEPEKFGDNYQKKRNSVELMLHELCRKIGYKISKKQIIKMTVIGNYYSTIGFVSLGILYDDYFAHIKKMDLPEYYKKTGISVFGIIHL